MGVPKFDHHGVPKFAKQGHTGIQNFLKQGLLQVIPIKLYALALQSADGYSEMFVSHTPHPIGT